MTYTQLIIEKIYNGLGTPKPRKSNNALIATDEIEKILKAQRAQVNTPANNLYEMAGFKATGITSRMVQNQIAYGAAQ